MNFIKYYIFRINYLVYYLGFLKLVLNLNFFEVVLGYIELSDILIFININYECKI